MLETRVNGDRTDIAIPCEDCPLLIGSGFERSKIHFSKGGHIFYEPENQNCGHNVKLADGPEATEIRRNIKACREPEYDNPGVLGRVGLKKVAVICPAFPGDPRSRRDVNAHLTRIRERTQGI